MVPPVLTAKLRASLNSGRGSADAARRRRVGPRAREKPCPANPPPDPPNRGYTAAALLFAAGALLWFVNQRATAQAESQAAGRAHFVADILLRDRLTRADFARPVRATAAAELDTLFTRVVRSRGIKRVNLIAPDGLITYSTEHRLIGVLASDRTAT